MIWAQAATNSIAKSRSETASMLFSLTAAKRKLPGHEVPVDGQHGAGKGPGAQRHDVHPAEAVLKPPAVALEHLIIGKQVMAEQDGLRPLQVGIPGQHHVHGAVGKADEHLLQRGQQFVDLGDLVAQVHPDVQRDLVVPAPRRVQLAAHGADLLDQAALDVHVDVFEGRAELERARYDLVQGCLRSPRMIWSASFLVMIAGLRQHGRMGDAAGNIIGIEPPVVGDRGRELLHQLVRRLGEPAAQGLALCRLVRLLASFWLSFFVAILFQKSQITGLIPCKLQTPDDFVILFSAQCILLSGICLPARS